MPAFNFDSSQYAPSQGAPGNLPVSPPDGWPVVIISCEQKPTNAGDGWFAEFILQITEGQHQGASGAYRLNLANPSEEAVRIAMSQLSALCYVTNTPQITDFDQLANKPFRAIVKPQTGPESHEKGYTFVDRVLHLDGRKPGQQGNNAQAAAPATGPPPQTAQPVRQQQQPQGWPPTGATPEPQQQTPPAQQQPAAGPTATAPPWAKPQGQAPF